MKNVKNLLKLITMIRMFRMLLTKLTNKLLKYRSLFLALITIFITTSSYTIFKFNKRPKNNPTTFIKKRKCEKKVVVCIGDSNTQGAMAYNFVDELKNDKSLDQFEFLNAGINGDLAYNVLKRLDEVIACNPDYIILLIGSNDILSTLNLANELRLERKKNLPTKPNKEWYVSNLIQIIQQLKLHTKSQLAVISLPLISEASQSVPYNKSIEYSQDIKKIAEKENIVYLPLNELQQEYFKKEVKKQPKKYDSSLFVYFVPAFRHYVLRQSWQDISKDRGLSLTVDTVHQNKIGAIMIKELITNFLLTQSFDERKIN